MTYKTFLHTMPNGELAKFTIKDKHIDGIRYYYACVINTELPQYKNATEAERQSNIGIRITDGKGNCIYYKDSDKLEADIISFYGKEWLKTQL